MPGSRGSQGWGLALGNRKDGGSDASFVKAAQLVSFRAAHRGSERQNGAYTLVGPHSRTHSSSLNPERPSTALCNTASSSVPRLLSQRLSLVTDAVEKW